MPQSTAAACLHSAVVSPQSHDATMSPGCGNRPLSRSVSHLGDIVGQEALAQLGHRFDPAGARRTHRHPGRCFESPYAERDMVERRADHHRVDAAGLYGQMAHAAVAQAGPAVRQDGPRIRRTNRCARTSASPRSCWRRRSSAQLHRLHSHAVCDQSVYLRDGPCALRVYRYVAGIPVHCQNLLHLPAGSAHGCVAVGGHPVMFRIVANAPARRLPARVLKGRVQPRPALSESAAGGASVRRQRELRTVRSNRLPT